MITELPSPSGRGNVNESRLNMELTPYLKILQIIALHGSKVSLVLVDMSLHDHILHFLPHCILTSVLLLLHCSCDSLVGQSKNIFVTNLGWVCHLLRWLLSNVYTSISDWQEAVLIINQTIPSFINLVFNENQTSCTFSINLGISDKTKEIDPSQRYNVLQFHSEAWTKESTWDSLSLASSFTTILNSAQHHKSLNITGGNTLNFIEQTKVCHPAPAHLTFSSQFFLIEQLPKLCRDTQSSNIIHESTDLSTQQELFCLWRWMFVFCYYKRSFGQITTCQENHTGSSVLHKYLLHEFNSITSRLSFQNEDTCWKTVSGLRNFFSLFAAVLVMEYDKNSSNYDNKSEIANKLFGEQIEHDTPENQREQKRARFEVGNSDPGTFVSSGLLWDNLVNLTNNNTKFGCLWWLIIDWIIRFMWQNTLIIRSEGKKYELYTDIEALLKIISTSVKVNRIALANECLVTMLHTLVVLLNYELYQGSISHVPLDSVLSAYNEIWEFAVSLFEQCSLQRNRLQGHKREGSLSGYRFLNHDRLACNLLSALFCLHNSTRNNHFQCVNVSNICLRIFTSLMRCLDLDTSHLNNSPWRVRLIVLISTCQKLPRNLIPCDIFLSVSTIPNVLLFNPGILFLLYNYTKVWNTDDDLAEKNTTIVQVPTEMSILLTGILWAYKIYLVDEFAPTIHSSNPWFHTGSNLNQPLFSNQDHIEAIDFIRKNISVHTRLNANLSLTDENIFSLVVFLATELSFIRYKFCLLKKKCKYLDELPSCYAVMLERVLKQILDNLISSKYQWCDSVKNDITNFSVQLNTDDFNQKFKKLEMFVKSLEILLELLTFSIDYISWISSSQLNQLIFFSTSYFSFSTSEQLISENTFQPLAVSSQVKKTNFGDEDFEDTDSSVTVEITNNQDNSEEINSRNNLYQSVKFQIFNSLFLFSLRCKNISLLKQIYQSLHESMSKIVLNDHDSIKWLSKLTRNISQSIYKTFSDKNYDHNLNSDFVEMITYFISSIVDTIREILKSLLARCSQYLCINLIVKLIRSLCMLSNSMVYIYVLQNQANLNLEEMGHWKLIGQHIDQLIRTVWSVGSKFSGKSLQGFEVATVDCLNFWINLYSANIIDKQNNPEYCLVPTVQHIVPIATFQLAKFLQSLIVKSDNFSWCQINQCAVLQLCQTLLQLLSSTKFNFISLKTETDTTYPSVNLNSTVYIYSLILKLLTVLSTHTCTINGNQCPSSSSDRILSMLYPELECLTVCCTQMTIIYNKEEVNGCCQINELIIEILAGNDITYFRQHIRPILLPLVLRRWEICPVFGKLALTDFYEPTIGLQDIKMISSLFTDHVPELVGAVLVHSIMQNMDDNSRLPQWHIITELCGGSKLTHTTLLKATNVCKLIHCLLELRVLYDMPNKSTGSSQSLTSHHYLGSFLINCLAKLYINLNYDQSASTNQISDTKQHHLQYAYDLISSCHINSDLVNRLYQIGVQFLCPQSTINVSHRLIPHCLRLTCWCAISNLIISLLFNITSSFDSGDDDELRLVREFSVWIFVNGHVSLLASDLTRIEHLDELLDSFHYLFVKIRSFSLFQQNPKLLVSIHHSTVYTLRNLAKNLLQSNKHFQSNYPDGLKRSLLKKVASILNLLVGENKSSIFNEAVLQLCDFPDIEKCNCIDSSSTGTSYVSFFEEYQKSLSCLSTRNRKNIQQFLQIVSNDLELFHIVHSSQLLVYPIKMFEELSFNMSTIFNVIQGNKSTFKFDMLFQQVKSILMEESTENKQSHVSSTVTNMNNVGNGGDMTEIDPASRGFNYGVPESDDFLDPMFYVKQQILSTIVCAICIPNSLITLSASEVLHGLFDQCSSLVISLLTHSSENQLPTYLHTILAPYIQGTDISSRSTSTRNKNSVSLIQKLDLKERARILEKLPVLTNKIRLFLENSLTICCSATNFQSWLMDFVIWFLESGLIQDDFLICIKPFLHFSYELTKKLCSWLIAYYLIRIGSNNTVDKSMQQFSSDLCDGITTCLSHDVNSSLTELPRFQKILLETLVAFNHFIQWIKRSGENITLNPSITINWLCAADRATILKRPQEARLFLELAWLSDNCPDDWITTNETTYRIWVNLCRLSRDLMGLIASQTSFLTWNNSEQSFKEKSTHFDVHPLLDKTKLAVHELLGNWSYLLSCYDKYDLNEELESSSNSVHSKLASCLQHLGANRLFEKFSRNDSIDLTASKQSDLTLKELRSAAAWRLNQWDNKLDDISNLDCSYSHSVCPPTNWKNCGLETSFYWLLRAASQSDWCRVSEIATAQSECFIEELYSDTIQFISSDQLILYGQKINFLNILNKLSNHLPYKHNYNYCLQLILNLFNYSFNCINFITTTTNTTNTTNYIRLNQSIFNTLEPFLTLSINFIQLILIKNIFINSVNNQLKDLLIFTYLYYAEIATIKSSNIYFIKNYLNNEIYFQNLFKNNFNKKREQGDYDLSISRLQSGLQIVNKVVEQTDKSSEHLGGYINCYIHGITVLCNWLYESRTKSAADLLLNYINPAINLARSLKLNPDANAFMSLAKFSDAQFTTLNSYLTSSEFATRQNFLTQAQKDVVVLSDLGEKSRLLRLLQRQSALEIDELTALTTDADHFLEASIDAYAQCLTLSDDHNLSIFRFISLWLSSINSKFQNRASKINKIMSERLPSIRADKFLPLVPQLAVRLSSKCDADSSFQNILMKLIERMVDWHPHHSAFTLLFLVNAKLDDDDNINNNNSSRQRSTRVNSLRASTETIPNQSSTELSCRIQAAQQLYNRLSIGRRKELLFQMKYLAEAYVDWANTDVDKYKTNTGNISLLNGCKLYGLVSPSLQRSSSRTMDCLLELVALPTCTFPIDRSGTYPNSSLIRVAGFSPDFRLVGGINLPKVISCLGTDGKLYRQLVKGKDDPRQDAVMQQVFTAANCLLTKCGKSNKTDLPHSSTSQVNLLKYRANWLDMDNGLRILTYKVIPMAQRSGVIEWCEDTVPLGDWLANERTGAHQRYRPRDMPPIQAKQRLGVVKDKTPDRKLVAFNEICEKLKPVLAYFFLEQFPNPQNWFVSRMAYIRSIAVTSVVGYLVGLGDRHPHNLLLHKSTGEIIHIDLGVAFDQGRLLPTP
uniref:Serine-protein kinase ATM n=1 Tax=Schistosoma haematobium TaxID=6185 RepID=A0A094ZKV8_SCHHA